MNITQIKSHLGTPALNFSRTKTQEGQDTEWLSCWLNDTRTNVVIHQDMKPVLIAGIATDLDFKNLGEKVGPKGAYTTVVIVQFKQQDVEMSC
jgi:hypothetical protein